jgi:plasmid stability protein
MEEVRQILTQLVLGDERRDFEVGAATLTVRTGDEGLPAARGGLDAHEYSEDVEATRWHGYAP